MLCGPLGADPIDEETDMFEGLVPATGKLHTQSPVADFAVSLTAYMQAQDELHRDTAALTSAMRDLRDLCALKASMETHGGTRALISFANHTGALSVLCKQVPAVEAMTTDLSGTVTAAAVENFADTILTAIKNIAKKITDTIARLIETMKIRFHGYEALKMRITNYGTEVTNKTFSPEVAGSITVNASFAQATNQRFADAQKYNQIMLEILKRPLPLDPAAYQQWYRQTRGEVGVYLSQYGVDKTPISREHNFTKGKLTSMGYDEKSFGTILQSMQDWIDHELSMGSQVEGAFYQMAKEADRLIAVYTETSTETGTTVEHNPDGTVKVSTSTDEVKKKHEAAMTVDAAFTDLLSICTGIDDGIYKRTILNGLSLLESLKAAYVQKDDPAK